MSQFLSEVLLFSKCFAYPWTVTVCSVYFHFFSALYEHVLFSYSICLISLSASFHILLSFLYYLSLFSQSLCCFVSSDPLALPVCCWYFLCPAYNGSSVLHLPHFFTFPCSLPTFCLTFETLSSRKFSVKSILYFQFVNLFP